MASHSRTVRISFTYISHFRSFRFRSTLPKPPFCTQSLSATSSNTIMASPADHTTAHADNTPPAPPYSMADGLARTWLQIMAGIIDRADVGSEETVALMQRLHGDAISAMARCTQDLDAYLRTTNEEFRKQDEEAAKLILTHPTHSEEDLKKRSDLLTALLDSHANHGRNVADRLISTSKHKAKMAAVILALQWKLSLIGGLAKTEASHLHLGPEI